MLRIGAVAPAAAINPLTVSDAGGLLMLNQTGEFLIFDSNLKLMLQPMLALSWSPNADGSVWTFKLRPNVKFSNGAPMTADDVVYTFQQLSDPKNASNALSAFVGVLTPAGVKMVDATTVEFHLEAPNGNFPYLVSSDNYNAIIVPNGTDFSKWQSTFIGTGAFKLGSYTQNVGATFVPNPNYWGTAPLLSGTSFKFYIEPGADDPRAPGRRRRRDRAVHAVPAPPRSSTARPTRSSASSRPTTASCRCATTMRRSPMRACARRWRTRSTAPERWRRC